MSLLREWIKLYVGWHILYSPREEIFVSGSHTNFVKQKILVTDKGLPKAMVKPNILTHVIEGYVIQEAGEPFAVSILTSANLHMLINEIM